MRKISKKGKKLLLIIAIFLICICVGIGIFIFVQSLTPIYEEIKVEAGTENITVKDFLKDEDDEGSLSTEITSEMLNNIGEYEITIVVDDKEYISTMIVEDTIAPTATSVDVEVYETQSVTAEEFVSDIDDVTEVNISFKDEVSTDKAGDYTVTILLVDEADNKTTIESTLTVKVDDVAPTISGTENIKVVVGDTVSYKKGVSAQDNVDGEVDFEVDTSNVNLEEAGTYEVTYSATDSAGNTATETIKVYVVSDSDDVTEDEVYAKADAVLEKIIDDSMTKREICKAIYNWVHNHMSYINSSDKSSWTKAAMYAFNNKKGDCYNYFAITKALLTEAGIENIDLSATKHTHYWNFVKVEEGWYHLDTTPRTDHPNLFLRTDAWMDAYSATHSYCFSYDPDSKPASATE
ncbi:MAG: DUF5011 domain-containing protein [Erysipelotrichaceae bacterium]|nr:DUF5011 domain-containing protein [Erysipelotrichaceae bacterium]